MITSSKANYDQFFESHNLSEEGRKMKSENAQQKKEAAHQMDYEGAATGCHSPNRKSRKHHKEDDNDE